jgi:hypothetical protein
MIMIKGVYKAVPIAIFSAIAIWFFITIANAPSQEPPVEAFALKPIQSGPRLIPPANSRTEWR